MAEPCAWVDRVGVVALVPLASETARAALRDLADCTVTPTVNLNLRENPGGSVIGLAPAGITLSAPARSDDWIQVQFQGQVGWISADYVTAAGNCG